jgi:GTPase
MMRSSSALLRASSSRSGKKARAALLERLAYTPHSYVPDKASKRTAFTDRVKALVASGNGGDGASIMSHEHTNEFAGPGGGNGGRGGHIFLRSSKDVPDLSHIKRRGSQIVAPQGTIGFARKCHGKQGEDLILDLPVGTQVVDVDTNQVVFDLDEDSAQVLLLEGGQGGKGNASFANRRHHSPIESTRGLPGNTMLAQFELKSIADCGLVGFPNAGKSSLLSSISSSKPKVAPYAFTTLHPSIGVINDLYGNTCRVADLPGLIEGAYENRGLGHRFLQHVERSKILAIVLDMEATAHPYLTSSAAGDTASLEPAHVLELLLQELEFYQPGLSERVQMIFANKMDIEVDGHGQPLDDKLRALQLAAHFPVFPISARSGAMHGLHDPSSGLEPAVTYMCAAVRDCKAAEDRERQQLRAMDVKALENLYKLKHRGSYSRVSASKLLFGGSRGAHGDDSNLSASAGVSLVDQQLDSASIGASGHGDIFDSFLELPRESKLFSMRDVTLGGKNRRYSNDDDEKSSAAVSQL